MIGCLPTQALPFLAVFVYATQAIAFEWKPGLSRSTCNINLVKLLLLLMLSVTTRAPSGELFTPCFTPGTMCTAPNSLCERGICTCEPGYFATSGRCGEFLQFDNESLKINIVHVLFYFYCLLFIVYEKKPQRCVSDVAVQQMLHNLILRNAVKYQVTLVIRTI